MDLNAWYDTCQRFEGVEIRLKEEGFFLSAHNIEDIPVLTMVDAETDACSPFIFDGSCRPVTCHDDCPNYILGATSKKSVFEEAFEVLSELLNQNDFSLSLAYCHLMRTGEDKVVPVVVDNKSGIVFGVFVDDETGSRYYDVLAPDVPLEAQGKTGVLS